eukprot:gnl/MRDRNA2_/MRDRNA2_135802_c0_seq1.p1 gnl/MRDRNA2_/MRDRNA2_135802_c0~~gnl/MRDRNA2_/MRDRNA2_135802_c0_seq1.p1  ORF type:complete len:193 (+),score=50.65 gnl/MRDRNA2_/MRDRNA2_135802_c0_seq1:97-675(+)
MPRQKGSPKGTQKGSQKGWSEKSSFPDGQRLAQASEDREDAVMQVDKRLREIEQTLGSMPLVNTAEHREVQNAQLQSTEVPGCDVDTSPQLAKEAKERVLSPLSEEHAAAQGSQDTWAVQAIVATSATVLASVALTAVVLSAAPSGVGMSICVLPCMFFSDEMSVDPKKKNEVQGSKVVDYQEDHDESNGKC